MSYEYLDNDPSTWRYHEPPHLSPEWQERLNSIAGMNPHGKPNLRIVWGGTEKSDRSETGTELKYHAGYTPAEVQGYRYKENDEWKFTDRIEGIPENVFILPALQELELGMLRFIVERWTSPYTLEEQARFQKRYAPGDIAPTLREFPREGIYDTYFIVETSGGKFRPIDHDVIHFLKYKWHFDSLPIEKQEEVRDEYLAKKKALEESEHLERLNAIIDGDLKMDKEELERRDEYWAKHHNYAESEARRIAAA